MTGFLTAKRPGITRAAPMALAAATFAATVAIGWAMAGVSAQAAGGTAAEKAAGEACLNQLCSVISKSATPNAVSCDLGWTWPEEEISRAVEKKIKVKWNLGSARCTVKVSLPSQDINTALSAGEQSLKSAPQPVQCNLTRNGKTSTVKFTLAPELKMKDGKATGASLGMANIEAPAAIKAVLWSASKLDSTFGAFEGGVVKEVNKFLTKGCKRAQ